MLGGRRAEPGGAAPLAGLKVVEVGGEVATRYCGRLFAALGAEVTRIGAQPANLLGRWLDEGKRQAAEVDLDAALAGAGLVIAGQSHPAVAQAEARLAGLARRPILLALTWFDRRGPYAPWRVNDPIMQAMTGAAFAFGPREGPPVLAKGHGPQIVAGLTAFIAALGALMGERAPSLIETSVFEAALCFTETGAVAAAASGFKSQRLGVNRFAPTYPCTIYPTTDGHVGVTALTPAQWTALAGLLGRPDLAADPTLAATYQRLMKADALDVELAPLFAKAPTAYWVEAGERLRIPITPAPRPGDLPHLEHWRFRRSFTALGGTADAPMAPALPFRFRFGGAKAPR
ncbi:MAG: CoA transferase, partial [Caulobacteraceae bacterium]